MKHNYKIPLNEYIYQFDIDIVYAIIYNSIYNIYIKLVPYGPSTPWSFHIAMQALAHRAS